MSDARPTDRSGPRPVLEAAASGYAPPKPRGPIDLQLAGNEGMEPPATLLDRLAPRFTQLVRRYPNAHDLEALLAERIGVPVSRLTVTAGADEALDRICRAYLEPGRVAVVPVPTFEMLPRYIALSRGTFVAVPWLADPYPVDAVLAAHDSPAMIAIVTPNNPTGLSARPQDIEAIAMARPDSLVLVDAAYAEFARIDPTEAALRFDNVVVTRTLSKAYGLAGLRVGYAIGAEHTIAALRRAASPFPVAGPSLALAEAWLQGDADREVRTFVDTIEAERGALADKLEQHGFDTWRGDANFVTARARSPELAVWVQRGLASLGIAVRIWPGREHLETAVRITCPGNDAQLQRLLRAIDVVLQPESLAEGPHDADGSRTWSFVTTPDGAHAARKAGALPLGIAADEAATDALHGSGCADVGDSRDSLLASLGAMIPGLSGLST